MRQEDTSERRIQEAGAAGAKASSRGWDSEGLFRRHHDPSTPGLGAAFVCARICRMNRVCVCASVDRLGLGE